MSKAYVGNRVQNVDIGEELDKVTRVVLVVDSDHVYTAGNDTGRTIEREIPWGSQAMADSILRKLSGVVYKPFSAERAMISPAFEIGDPVTVGGVYSRVIGADINYSISGLFDIYAPDLDVTEDEYPSEKTQQSSIQRDLAKVRSSITKTAEQIRLEVSNEVKGLNSSITQTASDIRLEVSKKIGNLGGYTDVASAITQTASSITSTVTREYKSYTDGKIGDLGTDDLGQTYTVESKIAQTASSIKQTVFGYLDSDEQGNPVKVSSSIETALDGITLTASNNDANTISTIKLRHEGIDIDSAEINLTGLVTFKGLSEGTTSVDGACIKTGKIDAEYINVTEYIVFDPNEDPIEVERNLQSWSEENSNPSYITSVGITKTAIYSPTIHAGTFFGNEFNVIAENAGNGSFNLYGKYNGQSVHAVSIGYSAGTAPYITLSGDGMIDFNFMAAYFNCNVDMGANDISFNVNGAISSLRELESRITALEKKG